MTNPMIYLYAIAAAFVWVDVLRSPWLKVKPFTCNTCMAGWFGMLASYLSATPEWWQVPFDGAVAMMGIVIWKRIMKIN